MPRRSVLTAREAARRATAAPAHRTRASTASCAPARCAHREAPRRTAVSFHFQFLEVQVRVSLDRYCRGALVFGCLLVGLAPSALGQHVGFDIQILPNLGNYSR